MALRNIVNEKEARLRKVSRPVEKFDERLWTLLDDMADTMYEADGVGIAGVQVGVLRRGERALEPALPVGRAQRRTEGLERLNQIDGAMPRLNAIPPGCAYNPRCSERLERCLRERPELMPAGATQAACWLHAAATLEKAR